MKTKESVKIGEVGNMEERKVRIVSDSTCDLSDELLERYGITLAPLCIVLDDESYLDREELSPAQIFAWADEHKKTPKTAAVPFEKLQEVITPFMAAGEDVIFFGISEDMSSTCNVARLVGEEFDTGRLFVIDSRNLSTGIGLQVIRAAELAGQGKTAEEIVKEIEDARPLVRASFVVDTLTYLARGGRCSGATALLANTLKLHPCIKVIDGKMEVGKKYRGRLGHALKNYVKDLEEELRAADGKRVFITHSGVDGEIVDAVRAYLKSLGRFEEILETRAGGVISSHCGPGTLGVLYYMESGE